MARRWLLVLEICILTYGMLLMADALWHPSRNVFERTENRMVRPPVVLSEVDRGPMWQDDAWRWLKLPPPMAWARGPDWRQRALMLGSDSLDKSLVTRVNIPWMIGRLVTTLVTMVGSVWVVRVVRSRLPKPVGRGFEVTVVGPKV